MYLVVRCQQSDVLLHERADAGVLLEHGAVHRHRGARPVHAPQDRRDACTHTRVITICPILVVQKNRIKVSFFNLLHYI